MVKEVQSLETTLGHELHELNEFSNGRQLQQQDTSHEGSLER